MEASIAQVAVNAGVSIATVSRTFARPDMVSPKTRERVLNAAEELNYSISRSATAIKTGRTFRVALLLSEEISTWFNSNLFAGMNATLHDEGYDISIYQVSTPEERRAFFDNLPVRRNADAVVVSSLAINPQETQRLASMHVPIIGINVPFKDGYDATVSIDDRAAIASAVRHLIALGHRDIALVRYNSSPAIDHSADLRVRGFYDACRQFAPDTITHELRYDETLNDPCAALLTQLLAIEPRPTALCCITDEQALPIWLYAQRYGLHIPADMSITGFDDLPLSKAAGLTTVHQSPSELGTTAAQKALALIGGNTLDNPHLPVATDLILRASTTVAHN